MNVNSAVWREPAFASPARIQELLYSSRRVATGLHWGEVSDWLREYSGWKSTLWREGQLVGLLACTPPLHGTSWLRLCALHDDLEALSSFRELWRQLRTDLLNQGVREVCLLVGGQCWLRDCLSASGFRHCEEVVSLSRALAAGPQPDSQGITIRRAVTGDLDRLLALDAAAFPPRWRMSGAEMRHTLRGAASFTVLAMGACIHGFQITQSGSSYAHLARLAISPGFQGQGLGTLLLGNTIWRLRHRARATLTVNTQDHNLRSLNLYRRHGFLRTGKNYSVWAGQLVPASTTT